MTAAVGAPAHGATVQEERKAPMQFTWVACEPNCRGWIGRSELSPATPRRISKNSRAAANGATIVLDSTPSRSDGAGVTAAEVGAGSYCRQFWRREDPARTQNPTRLPKPRCLPAELRLSLTY